MLLSAMRNPDGREAQNLVPSSESLLPSSLRRRSLSPSSFPAAVPETDSSSTAGFDASTVYTAEQSDVATSSDLVVCDRVIHYGDIEEMEGKEQDRLVESNSKDHVDGAGNGAAQGGNSLFLHRALAPAHKRIKESPLSSDAIFKQSHAGLLNLCIVVLIAVNGRLIIENLMKYGLLIRTGFWFSSKSLRDWPLVMCCLTLPIFPLGAFLIEKLAWHKFVSEPLVIFLHVMLTTTAILYPIHIILRCDSAVLSGFTLMFFASIVWLKLVSYAHTNSHLRTPVKISDKEDVPSNFPGLEFEEGISFKQLMYFMVAPTLCYQQNYPRTTRIRKGWVFRQLIKLVICTVLMGFIIEQYINPIVKNSQHPLKGNFLYAIERVLKLSVPTLYVWLCMFYCFFHLWLNILAELLQFGDREFYKDWWNAKTVEEYWRMWNMPVHKWMIRHIYLPCRLNGLSKAVAILISFLVSAVLHELCIAVPCHIFKFWAFLGILFQIQENGKLFDAGAASSSQIPLVFLTKYFQNKFRNIMVGNAIFWFFFCILGQPMCVLLYYHDVMNRKVRNEWSNC